VRALAAGALAGDGGHRHPGEGAEGEGGEGGAGGGGRGAAAEGAEQQREEGEAQQEGEGEGVGGGGPQANLRRRWLGTRAGLPLLRWLIFSPTRFDDWELWMTEKQSHAHQKGGIGFRGHCVKNPGEFCEGKNG